MKLQSNHVVLPNGAVAGGALPTAEALQQRLRALNIHERTREERAADLAAAFGSPTEE